MLTPNKVGDGQYNIWYKNSGGGGVMIMINNKSKGDKSYLWRK